MKNKTDKKATIYFESSYIGDEPAWLCACGGSQSINAGKTNQLSYYVGCLDESKHKPLESLDEVYKLNGSFEVIQAQPDGLGKTIVDGESQNLPATITKSIAPTPSKDGRIWTFEVLEKNTELESFTASKNPIANCTYTIPLDAIPNCQRGIFS